MDGFKLQACWEDFTLSETGRQLTVKFPNATYSFHVQWLYDARCDKGPSRTASTAFSQVSPTASITNILSTPKSDIDTLNVEWHDGTQSAFPLAWLKVMGPTVGKRHESPLKTGLTNGNPTPDYSKGWTVSTLQIPEIDYADIFEPSSPERFDDAILRILDLLLVDQSAGILKIIGLPEANVEEERGKSNTLVTRVLKQIFGTVFVHPRRGTDKTFNVASHHAEDTKRSENLPNYDTNQILLPHVDHAHYTYPIQVQGWYGLEGVSENTFVSSIAALDTLQREAPDLVPYLSTAPMAVGRLATYYNPPLYQGTIDAAVTADPADHTRIKRIRWHPHLTGSLVTHFDDFDGARAAYCAFQEILRRDTHQLKVKLRPGDLYLWNNFRIVHGRERVLEVPRTGVGQTVPEQVVQEFWRSVLLRRLAGAVDDKWLVHMSPAQLRHLVDVLGN